jgi:hypothetical protein
VTSFRTLFRRVALIGLVLATFCTAALAQAITGTVTNRTNNKPSAGDDVVLLQLAQGMQELARTKTDARGHFSLQVPGAGLHLLRVTHDKANYFQPVQPGQDSLTIDVYSAAPQVSGITLDADVMRLESDPSGSGLKVTEHFFIKNDSAPPKTLMSEHPFELYLPAGAMVEGAAAKAPGGMAVQSALVPEPEANRFTIIFPLRPGETEFQVSYKLPYDPKTGFEFKPRPVMPTDNLVVMMPAAMKFAAASGTPYAPVTEDVGAQTYVARNVQPSQPLAFTITGAGALPRDAGAGAANGAEASSAPPAAGDSNSVRTPGKGIDNPLDNDAVREGWVSKYRWWLVALLVLLFAAGAGFMLRQGSTASSVAAGAPAYAVSHPAGVLQVLRDELFALETDRLEGRLSDAQYAELKSSYDVVLRRALARAGQSTPQTTARVVPE